MTVHWRPEPLTALRARYPAALEHVYDAADLVLGLRPGNQPQHVFDWVDGLRLIVSRERTADGRTAIHFTASILPNTPLSKRMPKADKFPSLACERWQQLAKSGRTAELVAISTEKGIPHFAVWETQ